MNASSLLFGSLMTAAGALALAGCGDSFVSGAGGDAGGGGSDTTSGSTGDGGQGGTTGSGGASTMPGTGGGGGTEMCDVPALAGECGSCLAGMCPDAYCACSNEQDCVDLIDCRISGSPEQYCWQTNPKGISLSGTLAVCGSQKCAACNFLPVSECLACQFEKCSEKLNECFAINECVSLLKCVSDCIQEGIKDEASCKSECNMLYPNGTSLASNLVECAAAQCSGACP